MYFNPTLRSNFLIFHVKFLRLGMFHTAGNKIGIIGVISIGVALETNTSLKSLIISRFCLFSFTFHTKDNASGDPGAESIARALHSNTSLKKLAMCGTLLC